MPVPQSVLDAMERNRPEASKAWDRMLATSASAGEIPRDVWRALFNRFGEAHALTLISSPNRPYVGVAVWSQPDKCLDTWERWIADLGDTRPGAVS